MFSDTELENSSIQQIVSGPNVELDLNNREIPIACEYLKLVTDSQFLTDELESLERTNPERDLILKQLQETRDKATQIAPNANNVTTYQLVYARAIQLAQTPEQRQSGSSEYERSAIYPSLETIAKTARQSQETKATRKSTKISFDFHLT